MRQDPESKKYLLGPETLRVGYAALSQFDIRNDSLDLLRELAEEVHELTNLVLLTGNEATYVAQVPALRPVQMFTQLGSRVPLYCTGVGKAMLAYMPDDKVQMILDGDQLPFTENTITDRALMEAELLSIRQQGYAVDNEEREVGVRCIAAPVFNTDGDVVGAVSVSGPSARVSPQHDREFSGYVLAAAGAISNRMGFEGVLRQPSSVDGHARQRHR